MASTTSTNLVAPSPLHHSVYPGPPLWTPPVRSVTPLKRETWTPQLRSLTPPPASWTPRLAPEPGWPLDYARRAYSYSAEPLYSQPRVTRSVTPPPPQKDDSGWVTVSTLNMSPFMILRIKALIELAAIHTYPKQETIHTTVQEVSTQRTCLKKPKSQEMKDLEAVTSAEDEDSRRVCLLNALLSQSRQVKRRALGDVLREVNENFDRQRSAIIDTTAADSSSFKKRTKLSFSSGASLICFDSCEKPRKIRENHAKHFQHFVSQQQKTLFGNEVSPQRLPTPSTATPPPSSPVLFKSASLPAELPQPDWPLSRRPAPASPHPESPVRLVH